MKTIRILKQAAYTTDTLPEMNAQDGERSSVAELWALSTAPQVPSLTHLSQGQSFLKNEDLLTSASFFFRE